MPPQPQPQPPESFFPIRLLSAAPCAALLLALVSPGAAAAEPSEPARQPERLTASPDNAEPADAAPEDAPVDRGRGVNARPGDDLEAFFDPFGSDRIEDPSSYDGTVRFDDGFNARFQTGPGAASPPVAKPHSATKPGVPVNGPVSVFGDLLTTDTPPPNGYEQFADETLSQISFSTDGSDFDPRIAPDSSYIIFASTQHSAASDLYRKAVNGRTVTQLTSDPSNDVMPCVSPDGARIAFASDRGGSWDVFVMSAKGGQAVQITDSAAHELHPSWSPDGDRLCYSKLGDVSGKWELWVVDAANPATKRFIGYGLFPEWSPNGKKVAFQRARERGSRFFSIWTLDIDENGDAGLATEIISSPVAAMVNPTWSPDGARLAFTAIPNPTHKYGEEPQAADLWVCEINGAGRVNLTGGRSLCVSPTWSTDGRIYFVCDREGAENIWSLSPARAIAAASVRQPEQQGLANAADNE